MDFLSLKLQNLLQIVEKVLLVPKSTTERILLLMAWNTLHVPCPSKKNFTLWIDRISTPGRVSKNPLEGGSQTFARVWDFKDFEKYLFLFENERKTWSGQGLENVKSRYFMDMIWLNKFVCHSSALSIVIMFRFQNRISLENSVQQNY